MRRFPTANAILAAVAEFERSAIRGSRKIESLIGLGSDRPPILILTSRAELGHFHTARRLLHF